MHWWCTYAHAFETKAGKWCIVMHWWCIYAHTFEIKGGKWCLVMHWYIYGHAFKSKGVSDAL